ncbi:MAG TPA: ABC transporter permease [Spirochaetia bacterium]|nr:ABC transporter permease [Spirochaetales bacterium]HRY79133.1 ABC transporter permease [Spirochaetia bacterium]HRZ88736.1 ABC transporter permease [Spirochaetia bacterium]
MSGFSRILKNVPAVLWVELLLVIVFSFFSRNYLTTRNLLILLQQGAVLLVISAAATFVIISGGLDLSLGAIMTVAGVFTALAVNAGFPIPAVIAVGALVGTACGAVNGLLISFAGMEPFIATLGMQGLLYGISLAMTNKEGIPVSNERFVFLGDLVNRTVPMAAISCGLIFLLAVFVQNHTLLGRYTFAIGGNEEGSRLSGVETRFWKWAIYAFAGFLTGLGAVVLVARLEVADPIVGVQWEFEAIAAAILGGTSLRIGRGDVRGTIVGVMLITIIRSGLNVVRVPSVWQPAIIGTIIILSIVFQVWISTSGKERK